MTKIDARVSKNSLALKNLVTLLEYIYKRPDQFQDDAELISSLKTQGATAALAYNFQVDNQTISTSPMSLNTLKAYANKSYSTGFDGINKLRISALEAVENSKRNSLRSNKRTKAGLSLRVQELEAQLKLHKKTTMVLLQALERAMQSIQTIKDASNQGLRAHRATEAINAIAAITSLNAPPYDKPAFLEDNTIINLEQYRNEQ